MDERFEKAETITIEDFIQNFDSIAAGTFYRISEFPNDSQAKQLSQLSIEITALELLDGSSFLVKGLGETQTALTHGDLLALKQKRHAHTHPFQKPNPKKLERLLSIANLTTADIDYDDFTNFALRMPSPQDLTLGGSSLEPEEIWNINGKTILQKSAEEEFAGFRSRMITNLYSSPDFIRIIANKNLSMDERARQISEMLRAVGAGYTFQNWE